MRARSLALTASLLLVASGSAVVATSPPATAAGLQLVPCATGAPRPCVAGLTLNGAAAPASYSVSGVATVVGGSQTVLMSIDKEGADNGGADLGAAARADTFSVTLDMGSWSPSIVAGKARDVDVVRQRTGSGYLVTVTGKPVLLAGQCDQSTEPWRCPEADVVVKDPAYFNNVQWDALWSVQIDDAGFISDPARRKALYGLDYFHNFAASSLPPEVQFSGPDDTASLVIDVANRRYLDDLTTLVVGHAEMTIPNSFLRVGYGIPDPSTITGGSLSVTGTGSGASVSVTQDAGSDATQVVIDGVTFPDVMVPDGTLRRRPGTASMKVLKVQRGVIKPTRTRVTSTTRLAPGKGRVRAAKAKARGARVTGYQARCSAGGSTVSGRSRTRTVVVTGLLAGRAYDCRVQALSKAGAAGYGAAKRLAGRP